MHEFKVGDTVALLMKAHQSFDGRGRIYGVIDRIREDSSPLLIRITQIDEPNLWKFRIGNILHERPEYWEVINQSDYDPIYYEAITEHANG